MKTVMPRSTCPISFTLDLFGDKWSLLIMRDLLLNGKQAFIEFLASPEKIASNILTDRLNHLVREGFVTKEVSPANRSKYLYYPTQKAIDLIPLLCEITLWGEQHSPQGADRAFTAPLKKNWTATIDRLKKQLKSNEGTAVFVLLPAKRADLLFFCNRW